MKIGIYDPYLDTLGGGEKYVLSIAEYLSNKNDVYLFWDDKNILQQAENRFNLSLKKVNITHNIFAKDSFIKKLQSTRNFDLIIYVSDGSIPFLLGKKNFLILQFPVNWVKTNNLISKIKLSKISGIICYSEFVKKYLLRNFSNKIFVIPPETAEVRENYSNKENIILNVGRFTQGINMKKQDVMIEAFIELKLDKSWKLVLAGGMLEQDTEYVERLKKLAEKHRIEIYPNLSLDKLINFYKSAKIYWHATGYGEDLEKKPELAEHFGITTVEAMSYGVVPVVINAGGQKEIVENGKNGFLWNTLSEFQSKTLELINDSVLLSKLSKQAVISAKEFSKDKFNNNLEQIILR